MSDDAMRSSVRAATTIRLSRSKSDRITDIAVDLDGVELKITGWETKWVETDGKTLGTLRLICEVA